MVSFLLNSCAHSLAFNKSVVVPAATGKVSLKKDRNKNTIINVSVKHLAAPDRLQPPASAYVVWMETKNNGTRNIGQLRSRKPLFSGALKGKLSTVTAYEPGRFFITAENDPVVSLPSYRTILQTEAN